jgi:putative spermidine/putrescine transport system permease protein
MKSGLFFSFAKGIYFLFFLLFVLSPIIILMIVSFNPESVEFPPQGFSFRWYIEMFERHDFINAVRVSFYVAFLAALFSTVIAIPTSLALTRYHFWGRKQLNSLIVNSPILVPMVLTGLALFEFFVILGIYGTYQSLILAHIIITMPFPIRLICAELQAFNPFWEEAAAIAGATKFQSFIKITLPIIKQSIFGGYIFAFIISWNNFALSIFISSAKTITLPVQVYGYLRYEYKPLITAISTSLVFLSGLLIIIIDRFLGLESMFINKNK